MRHKSDIFYKAMLARDPRFDGKFFVGVKTTGIYCRPICPAKPKRENSEFFPTRAAAERAGYRPCLRCRPESAPLSPAWNGKSAVVQRALRALASSDFFEHGEEEFAEKFGVSARHLRRLFIEEVGQTPKQLAGNARLDFARKLIVESSLPITSVAHTANFTSLRRFNDAFKKRFHRAPRELRKRADKRGGEGVEISLSYRPPFDWRALLDFYRTHLVGGVETASADAYERVFRIGTHTGVVQVREAKGEPKLLVRVVTEDPAVLYPVVQRVRRMFDLDSDPLLVANSFRAEIALHPLAKKYPGLRLARGWDPFEAAICTILGQLVSLEQANALKAQLVKAYGERIRHPLTGEEAYLFPDAETLSRADLSAVRTTGKRKETIRGLARAVASGELDFVAPQDSETMKEALLALPGIGPWSAEYILLRAFGDTDSFPGTDLILKRAVEQHKGLDLEKVRPWRSYAAIYLWRHYATPLSKRKEKK